MFSSRNPFKIPFGCTISQTTNYHIKNYSRYRNQYNCLIVHSFTIICSAHIINNVKGTVTLPAEHCTSLCRSPRWFSLTSVAYIITDINYSIFTETLSGLVTHKWYSAELFILSDIYCNFQRFILAQLCVKLCPRHKLTYKCKSECKCSTYNRMEKYVLPCKHKSRCSNK